MNDEFDIDDISDLARRFQLGEAAAREPFAQFVLRSASLDVHRRLPDADRTQDREDITSEVVQDVLNAMPHQTNLTTPGIRSLINTIATRRVFDFFRKQAASRTEFFEDADAIVDQRDGFAAREIEAFVDSIENVKSKRVLIKRLQKIGWTQIRLECGLSERELKNIRDRLKRRLRLWLGLSEEEMKHEFGL